MRKQAILLCAIVMLGSSVYAVDFCPSADLTGDCFVNLADLAVMARHWLTGRISIPDDMVPVPAGAFGYQNADPDNYIFVLDFAIGKYEVTVAAWCEFLNDGDPDGNFWDSGQQILRTGDPGSYSYQVQSERENYPVDYVSAFDAEAYAAWRSEKTGHNFRLPTEQEWEKAAGWDPVLEKLWTYPFQQDTIDRTWANYGRYHGGLLPVGAFNGTDDKKDASSFYGCYDMAGNALEFTSTILYGTGRVPRGGRWSHVAGACEVSFRGFYAPNSQRTESLGFRLAMDL